VLAEAVQADRDAVAATPDGHPERASYLSSLGGILRELSERTGNRSALAEAVQAGRDAVAATPADHPDRGRRLSNLGLTLQRLYERTGDTSVLAEAVRAGRDAVAATPADHPHQARYRGNLGGALHRLSERTGEAAKLAEAVQASREAVAAIPVGDPDRARYLTNLGNALRTLFERTGDTSVLAEAVRAGQDAANAIPAGHPERAAVLSNLGAAMQSLAERTGDAAALAAAVQAGRDAVSATPAGHPGRAGRLSNLGVALRRLAERTKETVTLVESRRCFAEAAADTNAPAAVRIGAYREVAQFPCQAGGSPQDALAALEAAVALLPQLAPRVLVQADREHGLSRLANLAGEAAAAAVTAGQPGRAVELLEQTRGILAAGTLDARDSDVTRLRDCQPSLADEFDQLRDRIDALDHPDAAPPGSAQERGPANARQDAHAAWDHLIVRIRTTDGFQDFLQPRSVGQLAAQAQDGPVVFTYTSRSRCDALIVTADPATPVRLIPLPSLTQTDAIRQIGRLLNARWAAGDSGTRTAVQRDTLDVLAWLWDTVTEPVMTALGHTCSPADGQPWPRVWWCPVGILAYLPLHAAGHHQPAATPPQPDPAATPPQPDTVLDRVTSSYTTTVRALSHARAQQLGLAADKTLIIAVPGAPPLPGVATEAARLAHLIPGAQVLPHPTRDAVLAALPSYPVAHFACHGYADWTDPAASQLILHDHESSPMTVADISALHLTGSMAYLSACDTTITSPALTNEAVHLTGAFYLAGYQHVIGTLWPINDTIAGELACDFYTHLTHHGTTPPDTSLVADALHHATRRLRDQYPATPTLWAAHTHTGP